MVSVVFFQTHFANLERGRGRGKEKSGKGGGKGKKFQILDSGRKYDTNLNFYAFERQRKRYF